MAFVLVSCLVLGPLAILAVDLLRGTGDRPRETAPADSVQLDSVGQRVRAPRPKWPAPTATVIASPPLPSGGFRPTGGRRDYFGDGLLDRSA